MPPRISGAAFFLLQPAGRAQNPSFSSAAEILECMAVSVALTAGFADALSGS